MIHGFKQKAHLSALSVGLEGSIESNKELLRASQSTSQLLHQLPYISTRVHM